MNEVDAIVARLLSLHPKLIDFSLDKFTFKEVRAQMDLGGELWASLTPTPKIGLGGYLIDPLVLRGGGGIRVPISAKARLTSASGGVKNGKSHP